MIHLYYNYMYDDTLKTKLKNLSKTLKACPWAVGCPIIKMTKGTDHMDEPLSSTMKNFKNPWHHSVEKLQIWIYTYVTQTIQHVKA